MALQQPWSDLNPPQVCISCFLQHVDVFSFRSTGSNKFWSYFFSMERHISCFSIFSNYGLNVSQPVYFQVVAAVGFKGRRLEIPSSVDPKVAAIIESCWAKYLITYLLLCFFPCLVLGSYFDKTASLFSFFLYFQRTLETTLVCQYHGIPETTYPDITTPSTPRGKLVTAHKPFFDIPIEAAIFWRHTQQKGD